MLFRHTPDHWALQGLSMAWIAIAFFSHLLEHMYLAKTSNVLADQCDVLSKVQMVQVFSDDIMTEGRGVNKALGRAIKKYSVIHPVCT